MLRLRPGNNTNITTIQTPNSPKPQKARQVRSNVKIMLIIFFFGANGTVHREFVPPGQTVNQQVFAGVKNITR